MLLQQPQSKPASGPLTMLPPQQLLLLLRSPSLLDELIYRTRAASPAPLLRRLHFAVAVVACHFYRAD